MINEGKVSSREAIDREAKHTVEDDDLTVADERDAHGQLPLLAPRQRAGLRIALLQQTHLGQLWVTQG